MLFVRKCILCPSIPWRMLSGKRVKNYLQIGIYWRYLSELKKVEPKKEFSKPRKYFPTAVSNFKKRGDNNFSEGASPGGFKKSGSPSSRVEDVKVEW